MSEGTTKIDGARIDRATIREVGVWMTELGQLESLETLVDQLLPGLRDAFRATTVSFALSDPGLRRFRIAAYCYRRNNGKRSQTVRVPREVSDPFWRYAEKGFSTARETSQPLSLLDDGSLALLLPVQRGNGAILFGPRHDGKPHKAVTQELIELLGGHIAALVDRQLAEKLAQTDEVSGALSRSAVFADLSAELQRAGRQHHPVTLGIIELDNVEMINERYGHAAGDLITQRVAEAIREELGDEDSLGRYTGREFMVVFPNASLVQASTRMEAIKRRVRRLETKIEGNGLVGTSISAGLLALEYGSNAVSSSQVEDLVAVADFALLRAKELGGDNVQKLSWRHIDRLGPEA